MPPVEALKWYVTSAVPPRSLILAVVGAPTTPERSAWKSPRGTVRLPATPNWTRAPCPAAVLAAKREATTKPHAALVLPDIRTSSGGPTHGRSCLLERLVP